MPPPVARLPGVRPPQLVAGLDAAGAALLACGLLTRAASFLPSCGFLRSASCRAAASRAASWRSASSRAASTRAASCRRLGLAVSRPQRRAASSCVRLLGQFSGSLPTSRPIRSCASIAGISMRRHHGLRARSAWRCRDDRRWHRWSGGHDQRGLVDGSSRSAAGSGICAGAASPGPRGAKVLSQGPHRPRRFALAWPLRSAWPRARSSAAIAPGCGAGDTVASGRPTGNRLLDRCLLRRLRDRRDRRLRGCDVRRNEHDAQIGHLDPSISPREAEARKPKSLATEGQAQQQRMNQQGEQQRKSESPAFRVPALDPPLPAAAARGNRLVTDRAVSARRRNVDAGQDLPQPISPAGPISPRALALPLRRRS